MTGGYVPIADLSTPDGIVLAAGGEWLVPPIVELVIPGDPTTQGSKRPRPIYRGRGAAREFTGKVAVTEQMGDRHKAWRAAVTGAARRWQSPGWQPIDQAVWAAMWFTVHKAKPKRKADADLLVLPVAKQRDTSKYVRAAEDALVDARLIADDTLIVDYVAAGKRYPGERPGALIGGLGAVVLLWPAYDLLTELHSGR